MQALKIGFARRVRNRTHSRQQEETKHAHVWQRRFYDFNVWSKDKLRYIHRNPVRRGLVETPEQWPWSSFRAHAYGEAGLVRAMTGRSWRMKVRGV